MNNKLFKVLDEAIYFDNAKASQEYAKKNPGVIIVRNTSTQEINIKKKSTQKYPQLSKTPSSILEYLNQHIISQDEAKKDIALAMYYHMLKRKHSTNDNVIGNGPVMIVGPTGTGKTFIVQKACEFIDTVFIHVDTSSMVSEGIVGYSIAQLAKDIMKKADYNLYKALHCVIFFDEMDKLFKGKESSEYGDQVASQLLRLVEGTKMKLSKDVVEHMSYNKTDELDTTNMQFILGGAFQWVLDAKSKTKVSVGFNREVKDTTSSIITLEDLYKEDVPKELLGRMSTIVNLRELSEDDYFNILTTSKSSPLKELIYKIELHGDKVVITNETLKNIAKAAAQSHLGVRAIKQLLKSIFKEALFHVADGECKTHHVSYEIDH